MRPLSVVTLIILGSSFAITFSLAAVVLVVLILGDEYPRLQREFDPDCLASAITTGPEVGLAQQAKAAPPAAMHACL
jgi:hypothetical protein